MRTNVALISAFLLYVGTASAVERSKPPFKWDSQFASPGTSLELVEKLRTRAPIGTLITFAFKASGFPQGQPLVVWVNYAGDYLSLPATVDAEGKVHLADMPEGFGMIGPVKGQAFDVALAVPGSEVRAQAKIIPFPIEAHGEHGCGASAELVSQNGDLFAITFSGFKPGESVETTSTFKREVLKSTEVATDKGEVLIVVVHTRRRGAASATAKGSTCTVTLQYAVGRNALAPQ